MVFESLVLYPESNGWIHKGAFHNRGGENCVYVNAKTELGRIVRSLEMDDPAMVVANAPRPLSGTPVNSDEWHHGRFYVCGNVHQMIRSWLSDDAWVVIVVTNSEIQTLLRDQFKEHGGDADDYAAKYDEMGMKGGGWKYLADHYIPVYLPYVPDDPDTSA